MIKSVIWSLLHRLNILSTINRNQAQPNNFHRGLEGEFKRDFKHFSQLSSKTKQRFPLNWKDHYAFLTDKTSTTNFDRHYIYHPAWAARILSKTRPKFHVDISSTVNFCTVLSAFIPTKFYDYRPADIQLPNLTSQSADLTSLFFDSESIYSLSCMHTVEHVGLGRYGDSLDYDGDLKAIDELKRIVAPGGDFLFVVPIGKPKIVFNAHRIYGYDQIMGYFSNFHLENFSLIPDDPKQGGLIDNATRELSDAQSYGCGCFWFKKKVT